jgi:hypothetical protein
MITGDRATHFAYRFGCLHGRRFELLEGYVGAELDALLAAIPNDMDLRLVRPIM